MTPEDMSPLERAVSEIRDEAVSDEVVNAAAARVWARISRAGTESAPGNGEHIHIHNCSEFQSLIPEFRAGRLPEARALLLQDHVHECVACRRVYEGRVVPMPAPARQPSRASNPAARWAVAAGVIVAGGLVVWFSVVQFGPHTGRAMVQAVNGNLYAVAPSGLRLMTVGEDLPDGVEIRTAVDSTATLALRDGSIVEMRERSGFSTSQAGDEITVHLDRGSVIVQAAKRRSGLFYVATPDCRVSVTGTLFGVSAGVKGSRVSVVDGEVRVSEANREKVLHPGDQFSTSAALAPVSLREDLSWSRNQKLLGELAKLHENLSHLAMPKLRYSSRLAGLLPASTVFFASIPNLAQYLGEAQAVFHRQAEESPELQAWLSSRGNVVDSVLSRIREANEYLGDEIAIVGTADSKAPVFLAQVKRDGLPEFLKKQGLPLAYETRPGLVLFSPSADALKIPLDSGFQKTDFYARIMDAYQRGAGFLLCADLARLAPVQQTTVLGARYLIAERKQAGEQMEMRATLAFDGPRTGMAAWLAPPSPMGALDYVSPDATFVSAFALKDPGAALKEAATTFHLPALDAAAGAATGLGGEVALALDGPAFPVPSWKLVAEVYDPARFQTTLQKAVEQRNRDAATEGSKPLRTTQETADGRTDYIIAGADSNPLTEAHYTFSSGYLIAAPTRALLGRALQAHNNGDSIAHAPGFTALIPRDHYENFSAVVYQNLGTTLAPLAGLLGALQPQNGGGQPAIPNLGNLKPFLVAAYGEPDRITIATSGDIPGMSLNSFLSGGIVGMTTHAMPFGAIMGTNRPRVSSR